MKYFLYLLVLLVSLSVAMPTLAQSGDTNSMAADGSVVVADVRLTDVTYTEEGGVITGSFLLMSWLGEQRDIAYAVLAQGPGAQTLDLTILERNIVLQEGQVKTVPFSYTVPTHLSGSVEFFLVASTKYGLPLSIQPLVKKTFDPQAETLSCEVSGDRSTVSCVSTTDTTIEFDYFLGSEFSDSVLHDTVGVQSGIANKLPTPSLPGQYVLQVRDTETAELVQTQVRVPGAYGFIMSSVLDQEPDGISGIITARVSPLLGASVAVSLLGTGNTPCGDVAVPLEGTAAQFTVTPNCGAGEALIVLKNGDGAALAEERLPFTFAAYVPKEGEEPSGDANETNDEGGLGVGLLVVGLIIILIILMLIWHKRRNATPTLLLALALFGTFTLAHEVEAVTIGAMDWNSSGEASYSTWVTITPDKGSYMLGEAMVITAAATVSTDAGANGVDLTDSNVAYNKEGGVVRWDNPTHAGGPVLVDPSPLSLPNNSTAGPFVGTSMPETVSGLTVGSHYLRMRMNFATSITLPKQASGNMMFNVIAPPSVDINFR